MTFSFFKTVFVSIRFSFFVSELPLEIATRVPLLPQTLFGGVIPEPEPCANALPARRLRFFRAGRRRRRDEGRIADSAPPAYPFGLLSYPFR